MRSVFAADGTWLELPEPFVGLRVNEPAALAAMEKVSVADVPDGSAATDVIEIVGGIVAAGKQTSRCSMPRL